MLTSSLRSTDELNVPPIFAFGFLILAIAGFWAAYIIIFKVNCIYAVPEVEYLRKSSFSEILGIMNFGNYKRFSPLGFGLWGYLDIHVLVPLLGKAGESNATLAEAGRLLWFHVLFLTALCGCVAFVGWKLFQSTGITVLLVLLIGLNDAVPFQFRFASTLLCYQLQATTVFVFYFLLTKERTAKVWLSTLACVTLSLLTWEQGINLLIAFGVYLAITALLKVQRGCSAKTELLLLSVAIAMLVVYVVIRASGATETLANNNEASFFFSYGNPLLMLDDLLLNFSGLVEQSIRQIFPFPFQSFSVLLGTDMNRLNLYNASYSQFPNMSYRMLGLWFSGFCFSLFWVLLSITAHLANQSKISRRAALLTVCIFGFGFMVHLPIMHRDYFYIPGFALGYKASVSYVGFVFLIGLVARGFGWPVSGGSFPQLVWFSSPWIVSSYLVSASAVRALALTLPQRFPW